MHTFFAKKKLHLLCSTSPTISSGAQFRLIAFTNSDYFLDTQFFQTHNCFSYSVCIYFTLQFRVSFREKTLSLILFLTQSNQLLIILILVLIYIINPDLTWCFYIDTAFFIHTNFFLNYMFYGFPELHDQSVFRCCQKSNLFCLFSFIILFSKLMKFTTPFLYVCLFVICDSSIHFFFVCISISKILGRTGIYLSWH